jgi:hypothetical protein
MSNNLLTVVVLLALIGTFLAAPLPPTPTRALAPRATTTAVVVRSSNAAVSTLQAHQAPIPLVRNLPASLTPAILSEASPSRQEPQTRDDSERKSAARAAIEADGYRGVTVLGRGTDGTWRAKAYRGATEVRLMVDDAGRVSME